MCCCEILCLEFFKTSKFHILFITETDKIKLQDIYKVIQRIGYQQPKEKEKNQTASAELVSQHPPQKKK